MNNTIFKEKTQAKIKLLKNNNLDNKKLALWLLVIDEELIDNVLFDALKILPANFVINTKLDFDKNLNNISFTNWKIDSLWYDFIVSLDDKINIKSHMKDWVVPILWKNNSIFKLLNEFDASKVEWNAFLFEDNNLCDIYYAIIRYLENYKFPYDNKALVKNILNFN